MIMKNKVYTATYGYSRIYTNAIMYYLLYLLARYERCINYKYGMQ